VICSAFGAEPEKPAKPKAKIIPGQVIVPTAPGEMRRIWGELVSLDRKNRTGTFRNQGNDEIMDFVVMPYAELLHHAAPGDLQDYIVGERAIFRLHEDETGKWKWLTYIQDEMNFLNGHGECFIVKEIDPKTGTIVCRQGKPDESYIREENVVIRVDDDTKYFRNGELTTFDTMMIGDRLRTKTHGTGKGPDRVAWFVFFDIESLLKMQAEQKLVHAGRMHDEGLPGYCDTAADGKVTITLFRQGDEWAKKLKPKMTARLAPAGVDRKPSANPIDVTIVEAKMQGSLGKVTLETTQPLPAELKPTAVVRLFVPEVFSDAKTVGK
jgi:hypothetical protein